MTLDDFATLVGIGSIAWVFIILVTSRPPGGDPGKGDC